jgi:RND family efflux transporter MFP subunit
MKYHDDMLSCAFSIRLNPSGIKTMTKTTSLSSSFINALLASVLVLFSSFVAAAEMSPMPVIVAQPEVRELVEFDEFTGRFQAYQEVDVRAQVSGYLAKIHFEDGQYVNEGDLLFSIDAKPYKAAVAEARAELKRMESELVLAEQEVERARRLVKMKAMSQEELDTRNATLNIAKANIESNKAMVTTASINLGYTEIRAPISGRISNRRIDVGNLIQLGGIQVLTTIVTEEPLYFIFDVSEADYLKYQRRNIAHKQKGLNGADIDVKVRLLDEQSFEHIGQLNFIDNQLDMDSSTIRLRATFADNSEGLLVPGLFGRVQIPVSDKKPTMLISDKAILSDMANKIVMTVNEENVVVPKPVKLGRLYEGLRIIESGLEATDKVVIEGLFRARPGSTVVPKFADENEAQ